MKKRAHAQGERITCLYHPKPITNNTPINKKWPIPPNKGIVGAELKLQQKKKTHLTKEYMIKLQNKYRNNSMTLCNYLLADI